MRFFDDRHAAPAILPPSPARRRGALAVLMAVAGAAALSACGSGISLDEPIESRVWRLARLGQQPVAAGADPQRDPQVQFDGTRMSGSGGCNRITGGYQRDGHTLRIGPLVATRMACLDAERGMLESAFVDALQATASYSLLGSSQLTLLDASGRTLAVLENR